MVSETKLDWFIILCAAIWVLSWVCAQLRECNPPQEDADHQHGNPVGLIAGNALKKAKQCGKLYCKYIEKPKNQVALFTLFAILYYTLLTQGQLSEAHRQADSAEAAERAFIDFDSWDVSYTDTGGIQKVQIRPKMINEGNSPARHVTYATLCAENFITKIDETTRQRFNILIPTTRGMQFSTPLVIGAHSSWPGSICIVDETSWQPPSGFSAVSAVQYTDIFGKCHVTISCGMFFYMPGKAKNDLITNACTPYCADDNCPWQCNEGPFESLAEPTKPDPKFPLLSQQDKADIQKWTHRAPPAP